MGWILAFICIDFVFIISCLNDIRRGNCGRINRIVRKLDEIIGKLDKIEKDRSN